MHQTASADIFFFPSNNRREYASECYPATRERLERELCMSRLVLQDLPLTRRSSQRTWPCSPQSSPMRIHNYTSAMLQLSPSKTHCRLAYVNASSPSPSSVFTSVIQDAARQTEAANRWLAFDAVAKSKIKQETLVTLASPMAKAGSFAAQVVAAIAAVELPHDQWPDLIELLLGFVNNSTNANLKIATLQTIGYICESIVRGLTNNCLIASPFSSRNLRF